MDKRTIVENILNITLPSFFPTVETFAANDISKLVLAAVQVSN
jgi:hypothetical protein